MKVNLTIVEQLAGFALPAIDEVVARVNARLGGIEAVTNLGEQYGGARIVRVVECVKHPDADRLSVTKIDDGGVTPDVPRDENGLVRVVCGAPNVHADMWAVWLPPKTAVPASIAEGEPFVLDARPLRGVLSQGMLAAADELAIGTDHEGIVEITERDMPSGVKLSAGASFAEVFGLTGFVLDIENKMFTHRPDCFGQLGVAREMAGIFGHQFTSPEWYKATQEFAAASGLSLTVTNEAPDKVPRFMAVAIDGVTVGPSPLWLQCQLVAMGGKPINNIVDATNYVMLMTAQPTHAYDYDKMHGQTLTARMAHEGERLTLLGGKEIQLTPDDIVIADSERVIGLAGIMGGNDTEVSAETTRVILECANFDMYAVRRAAMRHGVFTDALARFNKGQSPLQTAPVLKELIRLVGGQQASEVCDEKVFTDEYDDYFGGRYAPANIGISSQFVRERLGAEFSADAICQLLELVEIDAHSLEGETDGICLTVPFWRTDLELPEDIVEEVGRLHGFDELPRELPRRSARPAPKNSRRQLKQAVRQSLSRAGANEVLSYSFVHENIIKKAGQDAAQAYKLSNALSPDLQYYRLTVLPSLLDKVHMNIKAGHDEFALFEMGKGHIKMHGLGEDGLPDASQFTDLVYAAKKPREGAPFYRVRRLIEQLGRDLGCEFVFKPIERELHFPVAAPFDHTRSALVETTDGQFIGLVGELKQSVIKQFKLPAYVAAATLDTASLEAAYMVRHSSYQPLSRYPSTSQDISLRVAATMPFVVVQSVIDEVITRQSTMAITAAPLTIYQPKGDATTKTLTFRLSFTAQDRTLTDKDTAAVVNQIAEQAAAALRAERA
ncbi:MAG: phenylalanine--tRNA ligase subunit beta [Candidatus Saccharibacteria bacterium]|nr:phenylalanine--tRNA ligase subunit beta [Candidatus Saccharibacteria bacterium]